MQRLRVSKGALTELLIVTTGVLIALSVDTIREWRANDQLAAEARGNILSEIRANKARLDQLQPQVARNTKEYVALRTRIADASAGKPAGEGPARLNYTRSGLSASAYHTAEITGAFRYLEYGEARSYSSLYELQSQYVRLADEVVEATGSIIAPMMFTPIDKLSRTELEAAKRDLEHAFAKLNLQSQTGMLLTRAYADALTRAASDRSVQADESSR